MFRHHIASIFTPGRSDIRYPFLLSLKEAMIYPYRQFIHIVFEGKRLYAHPNELSSEYTPHY